MNVATLDADGEEFDQARADFDTFARAIISAWPRRFVGDQELGRDEQPWFKDFAATLPALEDPELIDEFLEMLATRDWQTSLERLLRESFKRFDSGTMFTMLKRFLTTTPVPNEYGRTPAPSLPIRDAEWIFEIAGSRNQAGLEAEQFSDLMDLMLERLRVAVVEEAGRLWHSVNFAPTLILMMKSAIAASDDTAMGNCLRLRNDAGKLFDKRDFDAKTCTDLVKWSDKRFSQRLESLSGWLREVREFLESETACKPKRPHDFSRSDSVGCTCQQCMQLREFLGNPELETDEIKSLKASLQHVQDQIQKNELDATTKLDRSTRPFTLKLTKTLGSYERSVERFGADLKRLASLP